MFLGTYSLEPTDSEVLDVDAYDDEYSVASESLVVLAPDEGIAMDMGFEMAAE